MYVQSTVYTQIYIQIYIFVNREDGAWWNFTTFKWPHGQCSGKTGRYIHHCYCGANGGEELLYWPCPACHLRTILCCTLTYYWTSQGSDTQFLCKWSRSSANFLSCFAKIQIVRIWEQSCPKQMSSCFANSLYCLVWCKKDSLVWQFNFFANSLDRLDGYACCKEEQ